MSIADANYQPSEFEGMMAQALSCSEERVQKLKRLLKRIEGCCDNDAYLSAEEIIGEIAELAREGDEI